MAEFRQWLQRQMTRLDGARERRVVALGAMALLIALSVGPNVLHALAQTVVSYADAPAPEAPRTVVTIVATNDATTTETAASPDMPAIASAAAPSAPAVEPSTLTFLFPQAGAETASPVSIAARLADATAIGMIFDVRGAGGEEIETLPATAGTNGLWTVLFDAAPGAYVLNARASLEDGRVVAYQERRAFQIGADAPSAAPADPSDPSAELTAPDPKNSPYANAAPLSVRVKNAEPDSVVFLVTDESGNETVVLATEAAGGGYWTAAFEGAAGAYQVRARVTIGDNDLFSNDASFVLKKG